MSLSTFERSDIHSIRLHVLPTDRFKTYAISAYIGTPLQEETVTSTALIPFVLRRGTESYPETKRFRERLDDLYGAGFGFDIYKRGDYQMVQFRMDMIEDQYVSGPESLLREALQFLGEVISRPALENGHFVRKYVESEKQTLRKKIQSIINDKIRYASERCIEEMCKNEPYRLSPLGQLDALEKLDEASLFSAYKNWLQNSPIDLYVVGNTTSQEVESIVRELFNFGRSKNAQYEMKPASCGDKREVNTVIEKMEVGQGKLNMGLRSSITYGDDRYAAALMYNGVLGGYPHSKLFMNVREKESLAYYASSRLDGHKGIITIQSGIELNNYDKAVAIIRQQLEAMVQGEISELELAQTKAMIVNQLKEIQDSAYEMVGFDFNSVLSGKERTIPELIEAIEAVTPESIRQVAEEIILDTIYFLRDEEGE
ncbi:EF-P 5-aminopentanol modification-associated protein YfmF [Paenibacillus sp. J2TS4]|uniref:EF-P 5-aminopentanol modification-associated protein YfmF n=1 Tax=Paenibacillus sp. J2TS4 TaxID=2807194 RepID=UPI001B1D3820|nr:pitrilysin family protein [Paenibacillus sp. J2TS4]GIP33134.1 putative inactive metalloprotease YmfF [Paenibacillus sp. J2TS4]